MNGFDYLFPPPVFLEMGQSTMHVLHGSEGLELPLDRLEAGRLTAACRQKLIESLQDFLKRNSWMPRPRALCAIEARGVSLRRITLPPAKPEAFQQLLRLQIESEFPLPPDELAWGFRPVTPADRPRQGGTAAQELVVVAVKKEVLQEYAEILTACGVNPVFTLGALARSGLGPPASGTFTVLDIGRQHSELMTFDNGVPFAVRIFPWGGENLTQAVERALGTSLEDAEKLKLRFDHVNGIREELRPKVEGAIREELGALASFIQDHRTGPKLYLTGKTVLLQDLPAWLAERLGAGVRCERMASASGAGRSAAILGLQHCAMHEGGKLPLVIQISGANARAGLLQPAQWKSAALAALLFTGLLALPYVEALLRKPGLARKLAAIKTARNQLHTIDRELDFLQYLKTNQPPYLAAMTMIANAAPAGSRMDSLSLSRRGDLSFRGAISDPQQAAEFRSKLIASGFFTTVVLEEQTPSPDRQKVIVRMSGHWNPVKSRLFPPPEISSKALEAYKSAGKPANPGGLQGIGTPSMEAPPGVVFPPGRGARGPSGRPAELPPGIPAPPGSP